MRYPGDSNQRFDDWKRRALEVDLYQAAVSGGAKLKRAGQEWVGPCPACGGTDRFGVNPKKNVFICRNTAGGDVIAMTQHIYSCDFIKACEILTGEPSPKGESRGLTPEELEAIEQRRQDAARKAEERAAERAKDREERKASAGEAWRGTKALAGTLGEAYLLDRGIPVPPMGWPIDIRFHPALDYELAHGVGLLPAIVARVLGVDGNAIAVWQIYLDPKGGKAKGIPNEKVGRGFAGGGAVRIGGVGPHIGVAEGLETALAVWTLERYRIPVWSTLSTSGMIGFEPPLAVKRITTYPDGDTPKRNGDKILPPPGMVAARKMKESLSSMGIENDIHTPPGGGGFKKLDFLDVLKTQRMIDGEI